MFYNPNMDLFRAYRFMLPVHTEALRQDAMPKPRARPQLDEQALAELDYALTEAMDGGFPVRLVVWEPLADRYVEGCIVGVAAGMLHVRTVQGLMRVAVGDVVGIGNV